MTVILFAQGPQIHDHSITMLLAAEDQFDRNIFHPRYIQQHLPVLPYLYSMNKIEQKTGQSRLFLVRIVICD